MTELLFAQINRGDQPIALPTFRIAATFDGRFTSPDMRRLFLTLFDDVMRRHSNEFRFSLVRKIKGKSSNKLAAFSATKAASIRAMLDTETPEIMGFRFYGSDENALEHPFVPIASFSQNEYREFGAPDDVRLPLSAFELKLPFDVANLDGIANAFDGMFADAPIRAGYMGFAFDRAPGHFQDIWLPPAHKRFRTALMGEFQDTGNILYRSKAWIQMRRLDQRRGAKGATIPDDKLYDYTPGLPDVGWRTYVGAAFRDRLGPDTGLEEKSVTVEHRSGHTVVTAGPAPIWGDLNAGEDISAYQAAYNYLKPAMADRKMRIRAAPGRGSNDKERMREAEAYVDRLELPKASA